MLVIDYMFLDQYNLKKVAEGNGIFFAPLAKIISSH